MRIVSECVELNEKNFFHFSCGFIRNFTLKLFNADFKIFSLQLSGLSIIFIGFYLFSDQKRYLLSTLLVIDDHFFNSLTYPLLYYVAFAFTILGMIISSISLIGYWTSCVANYPLLFVYFLLIILLLVFQFCACAVIITWPQFLGLNVNATQMVRVLQGNYGVPNHEQVKNYFKYF